MGYQWGIWQMGITSDIMAASPSSSAFQGECPSTERGDPHSFPKKVSFVISLSRLEKNFISYVCGQAPVITGLNFYQGKIRKQNRQKKQI